MSANRCDEAHGACPPTPGKLDLIAMQLTQ